MREDKSVRNNFIIAAVMLAIAASFFTINHVMTKKKTENFNAALGKDEALNFFQTAQTELNGKEYGTTGENVNYLSLPPDRGLVEIKEKMFLAQVNDVYLNAEDYLGKTIKLEGIFKQEKYYEEEDPYCFVIRYGPGCCGYDGNAGFEVAWTNDKTKPYPDVDSWVEATGVLKVYEEDYAQYLYLELSSLNVLSRRGAEYVMQ